jgi:methylamine dehydrogenase heavy chain|tara:strand:+ start:832 stop:2040 length:1209 start_codon:yes stop_codon:yes gene_type:complete
MFEKEDCLREVMRQKIFTLSCAVLAIMVPEAGLTQDFAEPLAEEPIPAVETLPAQYPKSWMLIHDFHFESIVDGRIVVVDLDSPSQPVKGFVQAAQFGNSLISESKNEIYTAETYYSRLSRGDRTDVVTIWDTATLTPKGEILLPGGKRQLSVTYKNTFQFTNKERWALVFNFTPAQSVTVVDLDARKFLGEIDLPSCAQVYPTGDKGFTTFCADGAMVSVVLNDAGGVESSVTVKNAIDSDNQPLFGTPALIDQTAWFVSYHGLIKGFDLSGVTAKILPGEFLIKKADGAVTEWRPSGWQVISSDVHGKLYILMNPEGKEGSHKDGGTEVWVIDPVKKARVGRIPLQGQGFSIEVTREEKPRLVVARPDAVIDVYDAVSGDLIHSLGATVGFSPIVLTAVD